MTEQRPATLAAGDVAATVAAAERALSSALGRGVRLGEAEPLTEPGRRNVVLRCRTLAGEAPASVVIKRVVAAAYDPETTTSWDVRRFFSDWVGAEFLSAIPGASRPAPRFYAGDRAMGLFVLEDLGPHRSLVEPLLGPDAAAATAALRAFSACLGRLHAATREQSARFERLCRALSPEGPFLPPAGAQFDERTKALLASIERLGVRVEASLLEEVELVREAIERPGPFLAYIHGDPCPDNVFLDDGRVRLIDFEFGHFGHALMDAVYGLMTFPTCWCASRLPPAVVAQMEAVYRAELVTGCPEARDDGVFETALARVCAVWLLNTLARHLEGALREDRTWGIATMRPRVLARLEDFVTTAGERAQLPSLRGTAAQLLDVLRARWPEARPLPLYPAFAAADPDHS